MTDESQNPEPMDEGPEGSEDYRALLQAVRQAAGWRVAPRHLDVAIQALVEVGEEFTVERLAEVVNAFQGERSQRQRRNTELWRLLGAQLAVRGKRSDPEAQQALIGRAKALSTGNVTDVDLLLVATSLGSANHPLTPEFTADVASWLAENFGPGINEGAIDEHLDEAVEAAMAARAERAARRRRGR